ncbi:MAG: hypothetical protein HY909_07690 [Deltaproteobacteria bacterium]|nr:hypothetical protein [Deltaproteobacteria bacterium]
MSTLPPTRTEPLDAYEAREITASGPVVHRDKHVARKAVFAMVPMALIALLATVAVALGAEPATGPAGAIIPFLWFAGTVYLGLTRATVRTVVTRQEVQVHWGPKGVKVPLAAITRCESHQTAGSILNFGWTLWSEKGAVLLAWTEGGKERRFLFPANDPTGLVTHIEAARAAASAGTTGVRVEAAAAGTEVAAHEVPAAEATEGREAKG